MKYEKYNSVIPRNWTRWTGAQANYLFFFSYRMETSKNSNARHKSIEESDDSDIDDIHQPAKRPRLRGKAPKEKGKA